MIVVDASVWVDLIVGAARAAEIERRLWFTEEPLCAPHLVDVEVAQTLRRLTFNGTIDRSRGDLALARFADLPLTRYAMTPMLERIWALRDNVSAYDAAYVALAEALDAPLLTCDRRLAATAGHRAVIEAI